MTETIIPVLEAILEQLRRIANALEGEYPEPRWAKEAEK